jgi:hypothetical protein
MTRRPSLRLALFCSAILVLVCAPVIAQPAIPSAPFVENRGQVADARGRHCDAIRYTAELGAVRLFFGAGVVSNVFSRVEAGAPDSAGPFALPDTSARQHVYRLDMVLVGANRDARIDADEPSDVRRAYYLAQCPDGISGVRSFGRITYRDIYPHIDLVYHRRDGAMKYDFVVRAGGQARDIRIRYEGSERITLGRDGAIAVRTPMGTVTEGRPACTIDGARKAVASRYRIENGDIVFDIDRYDTTRTLVIDPPLMWSTFLGGTGNETILGTARGAGPGHGITTDRRGGYVEVAYTASVDLPVTSGAVQSSNRGFGDWVIFRMTSTGALDWMTYYGGTDAEYACQVTVDTAGSIYVGGMTQSNDFPTTAGAWQTTGSSLDMALVKLNASGTRLWATYFGGSGAEWGGAVNADSLGGITLIGVATSAGLATSGVAQTTNNGGYDVVVARFTAAGQRVWCTYLGGTSYDYLPSGAVDANGNVYVVGSTSSTDYPVTPGAYQSTLRSITYGGYVTKLDVNGRMHWSTYYGATGLDLLQGVALDIDSSVYICGATSSTDLPFTITRYATTGFSTVGFISRFTRAGRPVWALAFGGTRLTYLDGIAVGSHHRLAVAGFTTSTDVPVTPDAYQSSSASSTTGLVATFDTAGTMTWGSYLGGTAATMIVGCAIDETGIVFTGSSSATDYPTTAGAYQTTLAGGSDLVVTKFCAAFPTAAIIGSSRVCQGDTIVLRGSSGFTGYRWSNGDTTRETRVTSSGRYWLVASEGSCTGSADTLSVVVDPLPVPSVMASSLRFCDGDSATLSLRLDRSIARWRWSTGDTTPSITLHRGGRYAISVVDTNGCRATSDSIELIVDPLPQPAIVADGPTEVCAGDTVRLSAGGGYSGYAWSTGESSETIAVTASGTYRVTVTSDRGCRATAAPIAVVVHALPAPRLAALGPTRFCAGDSTTLQVTPSFATYRWHRDSVELAGASGSLLVAHSAGRYFAVVVDTNGCTATSDTIDVTIEPAPIVSVAPRGTRAICEGDSLTLVASGAAASYLWSTGETTPTIVVRDAGTYSVVGRSVLGCAGERDSMLLVVDPKPSAGITGPREICPRDPGTWSVPLDAAADYTWTLAGAQLITGQGTNTITAMPQTSTSTIAVHVVDRRTGCYADSVITVVLGNTLRPAVTLDRSSRLCPGESVTLDAGPGYARYQWSDGSSSRTLVVSTPGRYSVIVHDEQGCSGTSDTVVVTINTPPAPVITASNGLRLCEGASTTLDAGSFRAYRWSNGFRTRTVVVIEPGTYSVEVTDSNGCSAGSAPVTIERITPAVATISGPRSVCPDGVATYGASLAPGSDPVWSVSGGVIVSGAGTAAIRVQWGSAGSGAVGLTAIDPMSGCRGASPPLAVSIDGELRPVITAPGGAAFCEGDTVELVADEGYDRYAWSTGETSRAISVARGGVYRVSVSMGGCLGEASLELTMRARPALDVEPGTTAICDGDSVTLTAVTAAPDVAWSTGERTRSIVVRSAGRYEATATDADGCRSVVQGAEVTVHPLPAQPVITRRGDTLVTTTSLACQWYRDGVALAGAVDPWIVGQPGGRYVVAVTDTNGCTARSAPFAYPAEHRLSLDTVLARVGDTLRMRLRVAPALGAADDVRSVSVSLRFDGRSLYPIGARTAGGAVASLRRDSLGAMTLDHASATPMLGDELLVVEMLGLVTAQPINPVTIAKPMLGADGVAASDGLVILSGCDVGTGLSFGRAIAIRDVRPSPLRDEALVRYTAPDGSAPQLIVTGIAGAVVRREELPVGDGGEREARIGVAEIPSGVYRLELRARGEASSVTVVIVH